MKQWNHINVIGLHCTEELTSSSPKPSIRSIPEISCSLNKAEYILKPGIAFKRCVLTNQSHLLDPTFQHVGSWTKIFSSNFIVFLFVTVICFYCYVCCVLLYIIMASSDPFGAVEFSTTL